MDDEAHRSNWIDKFMENQDVRQMDWPVILPFIATISLAENDDMVVHMMTDSPPYLTVGRRHSGTGCPPNVHPFCCREMWGRQFVRAYYLLPFVYRPGFYPCLKSYVKAVTPKCLESPLVDRDRLNAHPGFSGPINEYQACLGT
ncbi:hypothetical protein TNCV_1298071 [Trichonephila clavipes]|nr:hypothetical protein TNCV_1298071 [Trichonephila clavipes]